MQTIDLVAASRNYESQSERISNFVVYSDAFFFWGNIDPYGQLRSVTLENNDIDTDEMNALALSANKLTIIYDERIDYYQMVGSDTVGGASIELLFSKAFTPELIEENVSFRFKMTCVCQSLIRYSCYSSTLNCLLIKKAAEACTEGYRDLQLPD